MHSCIYSLGFAKGNWKRNQGISWNRRPLGQIQRMDVNPERLFVQGEIFHVDLAHLQERPEEGSIPGMNLISAPGERFGALQRKGGWWDRQKSLKVNSGIPWFRFHNPLVKVSWQKPIPCLFRPQVNVSHEPLKPPFFTPNLVLVDLGRALVL